MSQRSLITSGLKISRKKYCVMKFLRQRRENEKIVEKIMSWWSEKRGWWRHAFDRRLPIVSVRDSVRDSEIGNVRLSNWSWEFNRKISSNICFLSVINFFSFLFLIRERKVENSEEISRIFSSSRSIVALTRKLVFGKSFGRKFHLLHRAAKLFSR